ncbi:hypothetical protein Scep_028985 [Stephania cephalantha]|uniref:Uncharacterized protein n=1 Tax=Stephania cephalantha TaxID=152367 RepID=A0AAP0EI77_9MAGN
MSFTKLFLVVITILSVKPQSICPPIYATSQTPSPAEQPVVPCGEQYLQPPYDDPPGYGYYSGTPGVVINGTLYYYSSIFVGLLSKVRYDFGGHVWLSLTPSSRARIVRKEDIGEGGGDNSTTPESPTLPGPPTTFPTFPAPPPQAPIQVLPDSPTDCPRGDDYCCDFELSPPHPGMDYYPGPDGECSASPPVNINSLFLYCSVLVWALVIHAY